VWGESSEGVFELNAGRQWPVLKNEPGGTKCKKRQWKEKKKKKIKGGGGGCAKKENLLKGWRLVFRSAPLIYGD